MTNNVMKTLIAALVLVMAVSLLFGCTQGGTSATDTNAGKIASSADATKALTDVSSDISGISNSLNQIDTALTDTNAP